MTANAVTDEQYGALCRRVNEFTGRVRRGTIPYDEAMRGIQDILDGHKVGFPTRKINDPLARYRQIKGLYVVGPKELDTLFRTEANPLGLEPGWVPQIPVPPELDEWLRSKHWLRDATWKTRAVLTLVPPKVGNIPTSLVGQYQLLGVSHDGQTGGIIRQDVFRSNWFVGPGYDWANEPAVTDWEWVLVYERPLWTTEKNWAKQQEAAREYGMTIAPAAQDAWALNLVLAVHGVRPRNTTWSRTSTFSDGCPLEVGSGGDGVLVPRTWGPVVASGLVAASVRGVPTLGL